MAATSSFLLMSPQQQKIESTWYEILMTLAYGTGKCVEFVLSAEQKDELGNNGVAAVAQRCSSFNNARVEVRDDTMTDTVRITVLPPGSLNQESISESSPDAEADEAADTGVKKSSKVTRPPNAFILYRQHQHPAIVAQNPGLHNNEISKIIGKMWHDEPDSVKTEWKSKSENVKRQHLKDHPDYQYQPRKPSEKKRRMTKRKAAAIAAQTSSTSQSSVQSPAGTAEQLVNLGNIETPSFNYTTQGQIATFTFDPSQQNQIELFGHMLENHNARTMAPQAPVSAPVASNALPTPAPYHEYGVEMSADDIAVAESELFNFEASLEDALARELESMEKDRVDGTIQAYNDYETHRFTGMLEEMPDHMWGMEFVN